MQFDGQVNDVYRQYKELQTEFRETHKTVERLRTHTLAPHDLKREIGQLEEERTQLKDKISSLRRKTEGTPGFVELLEVTSALRREQEEETKLHERMQDQMGSLRACERQYGEAQRR
jgi:chromosome segregation ATPase